MSCLLEVRNLTVQYRGAPAPAVENLSFSLEEGEILSLHGPSGSGKSTVVWALMGMLEAYHASASGEITFLGEKTDLQAHPSGLKRPWSEIALIPQSSMSVLNPIQTIGQSMLEMIRAHEGRGPRAPREERCRELLRQVSLQPDVLKAYPFELSGGMMQRVSIAIAILYRPKLLIMDEATTGLDVLTEADLLGEIRRLKRQENMSILMISHDRILSDAFCDRRIEIGGFHG